MTDIPGEARQVTKSLGYTDEDLHSVPDTTYFGVGCGSPVGIAALQQVPIPSSRSDRPTFNDLYQGERVLDLGSGGGIDVFLAARKVGPTGQAIGLDVSSVRPFIHYHSCPGLDLARPQDMITLARDNAKKQSLRPPYVAFVQTSLADPLPVASNSIDCVLSNCVVNLLPKNGKENLVKEIYRVLKPGGRAIIDDVKFDFFQSAEQN